MAICNCAGEHKCKNCRHYKYDEDYGGNCCFAKPDRYNNVYWEPKDIPEENRNGDCYRVAADAVIDNPSWVLVHGVVTGRGAIEGIKYAHAWAEDGDEVIDLTFPESLQRLPKEVYYALGNVEYTKKYTRKEAIEKLIEFSHWGPWEKKFYEYA